MSQFLLRVRNTVAWDRMRSPVVIEAEPIGESEWEPVTCLFESSKGRNYHRMMVCSRDAVSGSGTRRVSHGPWRYRSSRLLAIEQCGRPGKI